MTEKKRNLAGHGEREELRIGQDAVKRIWGDQGKDEQSGFGENGAPQTISVADELCSYGHFQVPCAIPPGGGGGKVE